MPRTILEPRFQVEYLSILDSDGKLDTSLEPDYFRPRTSSGCTAAC